ncbi:hypothetical protein [Kitasatospora sp. NPDC051914]|uniref:hypothetical protein n=1 Tax=Kitasatospora sp. NPDC051914 TaxID=3154945 RepID=UPI00341CD5D1
MIREEPYKIPRAARQTPRRIPHPPFTGTAATYSPTSYDTVVVHNPTGSTYDVTLLAGTWTKVLDTNGSSSATGTTACDSLAVTVSRRN